MSLKPQEVFDMGEDNNVQFESSMQIETIDLTLIENVCVWEYECNNWVRSGVDGIEIETDVHSIGSPNEPYVDGVNDIENESDT